MSKIGAATLKMIEFRLLSSQQQRVLCSFFTSNSPLSPLHIRVFSLLPTSKSPLSHPLLLSEGLLFPSHIREFSAHSSHQRVLCCFLPSETPLSPVHSSHQKVICPLFTSGKSSQHPLYHSPTITRFQGTQKAPNVSQHTG